MGGKKWLIIGGAFLLLVVFIAVFFIARGGNKGTSAVTTIKIWSPFDEGKTYGRMMVDYLGEHPELKIDFKYVKANDAKDYEAQVVNAIASGSGPDIWLVRTDWLAKHQSKSVPAPADMKWTATKGAVGDADLKTLLGDAVVAQNSRAGRVYGIPIAVDSLALYVNTDVVREVKSAFEQDNNPSATVLENYPTTWAEVDAWSQLLATTNKGNITRAGLAIGTVDNSYAPVDTFLALLAQKGGRLFTEREDAVALHLASDTRNTVYPGSSALDYLTSFSDSSNPNYSWSSAMGDPTTAFVSGKAAMMLGYSSLARDIRQKNKDFTAVVEASLPQEKSLVSPSDERVDFAAYWTHIVSKTSTHQAAAWEILHQLTEPARLKIYATQTEKPTIDKLDDQTFATKRGELGEVDLFAAQATHAQPVFMPEWQVTNQTIQDMIRDKFQAKQTATAAVGTAAEKLKAILP